MARQAKSNLKTKTARARLVSRREPYYTHITAGRTLGYRRADAEVSGSWLVREKIDGVYRYRTFGLADDFDRADGRDVLTYEQARDKATIAEVEAPSDRLTVAGALDTYFETLKSKHGKLYKQWSDARIMPVLGRHRVDRLTTAQIEAWQVGLIRDDPEDQDARRRTQDTANRLLTILKAALNKAFNEGRAPSDAAWRRAKPFHNVGRPRTDHFESSQVRLLIAKAATFDRAFADLIETTYLTGARLGELSAANVRHFDADNGTLHVDGKTGPRVIALTHECVAVLRRITANRPSSTPLLPRADGGRWIHTQHRPMRAALALAELPDTASLYTLRHSYVSRAIEAGMPLSLIAENCGTSLAMIQKNYAHVLARTRRDMIEKTAPRLRRVK